MLVLALLLTPVQLLAGECEQHPVYCNILKLKPSMNQTVARELSNYIAKYSKQFGTDPKISIAIAMQESSLINRDREGSVLLKDGSIVQGVTDVGMFQLHIHTIENMRKSGWDIDFNRLRTDIEYQTYCHIRLLKAKIKVCQNKKELGVPPGEEWSCYHSYTPKLRQVYVQFVSAHLAKLK